MTAESEHAKAVVGKYELPGDSAGGGRDPVSGAGAAAALASSLTSSGHSPPPAELPPDRHPAVAEVHELKADVPESPPQTEAPQYSNLPEVVPGGMDPGHGDPAGGDVQRMQEELRRLDAEIAERERLQALRDQRAEMEARIREAGGRHT